MLRAVLQSACLVVLVSGCGVFKSELDKCHKPQEYQQAEIGPRVRVPDDLEKLDPASRLEVPFGAAQTTPIPDNQPCLIEPPEYTDRGIN